MLNKTPISNAGSYKEISIFWDGHDLADFWDQTKPVEVEVDIKENVMYYSLTEGQSIRLTAMDKAKGVKPGDLLSTWIEEKLQEV